MSALLSPRPVTRPHTWVAGLRRAAQARLRWLRRRATALHPFRYELDLRDVI